MKKIRTFEERMKNVNKIPTWIKQQRRINTLENEVDYLKAKVKEKEDIIKSDLYKEFMEKLEAPHKIIDLQNTLKNRTQQRNALREENIQLREENKKYRSQTIELDKTIKQRERYKKQIKMLKDIIKEGK